MTQRDTMAAYRAGGLLRLLCSIAYLGLLLSIVLPGGADAYKPISDESLKALPQATNNDFDIHSGALLAPILRPRVPGTPGSTAVLNHFVTFFRTALPDWNITFQNSTSKTPVTGNKDVPFVNLIASRDPPWAAPGDVGRLTLVAHYDSKYAPEGFIGAIDSAAPCAMIMHAVRSIDAALTRKWAAMEAEGLLADGAWLDEHRGIQVIFLDGEEAFKDWSATDSLYGSRALAEYWDQQVNPAMSTFKTPLSQISLFVLLDLLGSPNPTVKSYFKTTHWAYRHMATLEQRMRDLGLFKSSLNHPGRHPNKRSKNNNKAAGRADAAKIEPHWLVDASKAEHELSTFSGIQDDHIPFLARGVEVLHVIDTPNGAGFPEVWHTMADDGEHLDIPTVEDWSMLVTAFAAEWMELEGFIVQNNNIVSNELNSSTDDANANARAPASQAERQTQTQTGSAVPSQESTSGAESKPGAKWNKRNNDPKNNKNNNDNNNKRRNTEL